MAKVPTVFFLNGPNANLYGLDRSGTYGRDSFVAIKSAVRPMPLRLGLRSISASRTTREFWWTGSRRRAKPRRAS